MSDSDFFSFDKALDKLSLEEEDLKRLISAGEIRAFRDGSKMRLRAEDVDRLAGDIGLGGGEEDLGEVLEVEEVLFEEAEDSDQGMVTTQLSEEDTLLDDGVEEVEMEEVEPTTAEPAAARAGTRSGRGAGRARPNQDEVETVESGGMRFALIATTIVMAYGLAFLFAMHAAQSSAITKGVVNMFVE
jgi:excisionase family DNA binding protein